LHGSYLHVDRKYTSQQATFIESEKGKILTASTPLQLFTVGSYTASVYVTRWQRSKGLAAESISHATIPLDFYMNS
jgi:hypothetical protein